MPSSMPTAPPEPPPDRPISAPQSPPIGRFPRVWFVLGPITVVVVLALLAGLFIKLPYVAYAPGSAQAAEPLVKVPKGKGYDSTGNVLFLTVSVRGGDGGEPAAQALFDWLDPNVDLQPYDAVYPKESDRKTDVAQNKVAMTDSKVIAQQVAFEKLGYPVTVTGTGVIINTVADDLPVKDQLDPGDVITAVDGVPTLTQDQLTAQTRKHKVGDTVVLSVEAQGKGVPAPVTVKLSENKDNHKPIIGVTIATRGIKYDFPFKVQIDSGNVIGPSGGLVFTLAIIDRLTPGSLTGGHKVAVTGEIAPDGSVRPIGGVTQKLVAAEDAGADAMIVPSDDYAEAKAHHSKTVKVYKADTIDEALAILKSLGGDTAAADHPLPAP